MFFELRVSYAVLFCFYHTYLCNLIMLTVGVFLLNLDIYVSADGIHFTSVPLLGSPIYGPSCFSFKEHGFHFK